MAENDLLIENKPTKVYIKTDSNNNVTAVNSGIFLSDLTDWIYIDKGHGDKYTHAQGNYFDEPLMTDEGIYRYKYVNGAVAEKTEEEIAEEIGQLPPPEPTANEKIEVLTTTVSDMLGAELANNSYVPLQYNRFLQIQVQAANLTDTQAMEVADLYPEWQANTKYTVDTILKYGKNADNETQLYRVIQEHISQDDWRPDITASLYKAIGFDTDETPIWTQPLGAHDAYQTGDIVSHNGNKWQSDIDNNVWEPGVYGWMMIN